MMTIQDFWGQLTDLLKSRIMVIPLYTFPALINLLIVSHLSPSLIQVLFTVVSVSLISYSIYWYNDYTDIEVDAIEEGRNKTDRSNRPLTAGRITKNTILLFIVGAASLGLLVAFLLNLSVFMVQGTYLMIGFLYSADPIHLKKRLIGKYLAIITGGVLSCFAGAFVYQTLSPMNIYSAIINAVIYPIGSSLGDIRDIASDRKSGARTLPTVIGPELTVRFSIAGFIAVIFAGLLGYFGIGLNAAVPVLTTISMVAWIYTVYPITKNWRNSVYVEQIIFKRVMPSILFVQMIPLIGLII
jgi:4-hydroxybenzoate polyprenyltransferase